MQILLDMFLICSYGGKTYPSGVLLMTVSLGGVGGRSAVEGYRVFLSRTPGPCIAGYYGPVP
jgi:hypothetical protein